MRYPVGTKFTVKSGKVSREFTVVDYLVTTNLAGDIVKRRYVATYMLLGQTVRDNDILETTIARCLS